jgi:hypothetical protein
MADLPFNNDASQAERRRILDNDRKASTYSRIAQSEAEDLAGGRYAAMGKPSVTGTTPAIRYPVQPPNSPWASDLLGPEPPLGIDINAMQPVGEPHEVKASERTEPAPAAIDPEPAPINPSTANPIRLRRRI